MSLSAIVACALCTAPSGQAEEPPLLRVGELVTGVIEDGDPLVHTETLDASYTSAPTVGRTYRVEVPESGPYHIELRSYAFDAYLVLRDADRRVCAEDDDGLFGTHALVTVLGLEAGTTYFLEACALHGKRGPFEIVLASGEPPTRTPSERAELEVDDARRRVELLEGAEGPESLAVGSALDNLARLLLAQGDDRAARPLFERALAIRESALGPEHPFVAVSLNNLARLLLGQGDYQAAHPLYERALEITERALGPEHAVTATSLANLAGVLQDLGDYQAARPLYERALEIQEHALGPEHPSTAATLSNLAGVLQDLGDYPAARPLYERALAIHETALGPEHPDTATYLNNLATLLQGQGDYQAARPLLERALAIQEATLGPEHPVTATSLSNLAGVLRDIGDYQAARPLLERALATQETVLGPGHPDVATNLCNLAFLLRKLGDYRAARTLLERALAIEEIALGPEHPSTASTLFSLAALLRAQGDYQAARLLLERALAIHETALGPEHPLTAKSLGNLATLLQAQGDYQTARPLFERALAIHEAVLGPRHPDTASSLNNLATLLLNQGDYQAARPLFERTLAIRQATLGPEHPQTANSLNNLAELLRGQGDYRAARPLFERALAIRETTQGPEHPLTARSLGNLAVLLWDLGDYQAARPLFERALAIQETALGPDHADTASSLNSLALLLRDLGEVREAWDVSRRYRDRRRGRVEALLGSLSEAESYHYLATLFWQLELRTSLADLLGTDASRREAYEDVLDWKGRVARMLIASHERIAADVTSSERVLIEELRTCQRRLSRLALETDVRDKGQHETRLGELREERNRLELELRRASGSDGDSEAVSWSELRAALPERSAVVDVFASRRYPPAQTAGERVVAKGEMSEPRLSAWITRPDREELVQVDLGPAADMETADRAFLEDLVQRRGAPVGVPAEVPVRIVDGRDPASVLRERFWDRIAPYLEGVETIFVSPDGALATLPLETIQQEDGRFLIEDHAFVYLQDVTALVRRGAEEPAELDSLLAMGAVDFRRRAEWSAEEVEPVEASSSLGGSFDDHWPRLPATEVESQFVFDLHEDTFGDKGRRELLQADAPTEERLKHELERFSVLHLATHGFFQPEGTPSMWESAKNERGQQEPRMSAAATALVGKHPGLLSGLVCAGANRPPGDGGDDGYLTAEEVGWLDLTGVELVVLSACETGLGRPQSGEGLLGLRRAFRIAGAKTVVSSLWSVKDESTSELMGAFYENLWLKDMGRLEALRAAQLAMLLENRREHGAPLPSTWGAFVLSGEWR